MSFTVEYLLRLVVWSLVLAAFLGGPVWMSWRQWDRALAGASVDLRHRVACGHFFALLILPGTVIGSVHLTLADMGTEISREPARAWTVFAGDGPGTDRLSAILAASWSVGAIFAALRLASDAGQLRRLQAGPAPAPLTEEVHRLARRLPGSGQPSVRIANVPVPQVMGIVRSTLVVPAAFACLPAAEREAILLHELAHAARHDFAANLLQRLALAALWFQPAAWAIYRRVSREREACCDQLAVRYGASASALARALVRLAEGRLVAPPAALAVTGHGDLRWRLERLATPEGIAPQPRCWLAALPGVLALAVCGLGGSQLAGVDRVMTDLYIASALGPVVSVRAHDPAGAFSLRIHHGNVLGATVGDRPVRSTNIRQRGERVTLLGAAKEPVVSLRVTPFGRIEWQARQAKVPRT